MSHPIPGYLHTHERQGVFLGGTMITDHHGIPLDFKYTEPIRPTAVQKTIYGAVLHTYIRHHVLIGALAREAGVPPAFYITAAANLEAAQEASGLNLIALERTQFASLVEKGSTSRAKENECLIQGWNETHPMRVQFGTLPRGVQDPILQSLILLSRTMDVIEPLERLETALERLCLEQMKQPAKT